MLKKLFLTIILSTRLLCTAQEICNNGIDDDNDGFTDLNDPDCLCNGVAVTSVIPNASFEDYNQCPSDYSQLSYCSQWQQATSGTSDYFNTCNYIGTNSISAVGLIPFPDGNGIVGAIFLPNDKEYIGSCLTEPLIAGENYIFTFNVASVPMGGQMSLANNGSIYYGPINVTLYGAPQCSDLPVVTNMSPNTASANWIELGEVNYTPTLDWSQATINFTPAQNINAMMIGPPENFPPGYEFNMDNYALPYFLFDNLLLNKGSSFGTIIQATGSYCTGNLALSSNPQVPVSPLAAYQWYHEGIAISGAISAQYTPLTTGNYAVKIIDGSNCYISPKYFVNDALRSPDVTFTNPTCLANGSITINEPAEFYSFDNGVTWVTTPTLSLPEGIYNMRYKYASGCISDNRAINLQILPNLQSPSATTINATCGPTGSITFTEPAPAYSFDGGLTWTTNPVLQNLAAGAYALAVKNTDGCVSQLNWAYITETLLPDPTYDLIWADCNDSGSITVTTTATGYSFDGGITWTDNPVLTGLLPGNYSILIKDASGCTSIGESLYIYPDYVSLPDAPLYTVHQPIGCTSVTGSITIDTAAASYSFDNGATWGSSNTSGQLAAGTYYLKIKDSSGCQSWLAKAVINLESGAAQQPAVTVAQPNCFSVTGSITVTTAAAQYSFNNGSTWGSSNVSPPLSPGTYTIKIKNAGGCESPAVTVSIAPDVVTAPLVNDITYCRDAPAVAVTATGTGLLWYNSPVAALPLAGAPVPQTTVTGVTAYYVSQTINGCEGPRALLTVTIVDELAPPAVTTPVEYCRFEPTIPLTATGTGLLWYTTALGGTAGTIAPEPSSQDTGSQLYYVSVSGNGCESNRSLIEVVIKPLPGVPDAQTDITYLYKTATLPLSAEGANLTWYDNSGNMLNGAPVPSSANIGTAIYYVTQTIDGCEGERLAITVTILPDYAVVDFPPYFSPNNDALHDTWNIKQLHNNIKAVIIIFDRYGKIIKQLSSPGQGWDGTYNGHDLPATDYWFKVLYTEYGIARQLTSHFSLVR